ncbi:hypothetical protein AAF712_007441 [Marasmius tenuissimus]|uniref:Manganese lipoxygenase n=1 Tax=Marasmius tenuissimus TaxID=585030 RepID=A0ABR2ZW29_9AGAR
MAYDQDDVVIAVMGGTGSGKSSFIQLLTDNDSVKIGHTMDSETSDVRPIRFKDNTRGVNITIVDTPGFDDSRESLTDTDILKKIAEFLLNEYDNKRKLNALIYLQRISDPRFSGQSNRNLAIFRGLCGTATYKNVVVLTTFWDRTSDFQQGLQREDQLKANYFKELVQGGARFMRHDRTPRSASEVLEHVFTLVPRNVQLQEEIRLEGKSLEQTAAGFVQREEVERMIAKHQQSLAELREEMDAVKNKNMELRQELEQEKAELKQKVARWESEKAELHGGLQRQKTLRKEAEARMQEGSERRGIEVVDEKTSQLGTQIKIRLSADEKKVTQVVELGPASPPPPYEVARYSLSTFRREDFEFAYSDRYPPYMKKVPRKDRKNIFGIFDFESLLQTTVMLSLCSQLVPTIRELAPNASVIRSIEDLVRRNRELHDKARVGVGYPVEHNMYLNKNIGLREDWYTDAVFGQQQLTGTNSTTVTRADRRWVEEFLQVSRDQRRRDVSQLLENDSDNLFVQDYSDFRASMNLSETTKLMTEGRYGCASVVLFHLEADGQLHPLAITLDYQGSMDNSVTIFNRRIGHGSSGDEYTDWPWRYAKTCAQVSDWLRHEVAIHLVHTHLVEEVLIVAANRVFDPEHVVFRLLEPHWATTLPLNKAARETLVPKIIVRMTGFSEVQTYAFLKSSYRNFDWTGLYVPNDLRNRGFPVEHLGERKYHNYGYARNISRLWEIIRKFVSEVLTDVYVSGDEQVRSDGFIASFCREVRSSYGGQLSSFPDISTLDELIDFATMCIHIASPQHTAVNYLQQYYQTFVPNKPSALYTPLPRTLSELNRIGEKDLLAALPLHRPKDWLLMSQVPYLLSFEVAEDSTILHYAQTASTSSSTIGVIRRAARGLRDDLENFIPTCRQFNEDLDDGEKTPYDVLNPTKTAISILI